MISYLDCALLVLTASLLVGLIVGKSVSAVWRRAVNGSVPIVATTALAGPLRSWLILGRFHDELYTIQVVARGPIDAVQESGLEHALVTAVMLDPGR